MIFDRLVDGIVSVLLSNRAFPVIKYIKGSEISNQIGRKVLVSITNNNKFKTILEFF